MLRAASREAARAAGVTEVTRRPEDHSLGLYKALLPDGTPRLDTLLRIMGVLEVKLRVQ